MDEILLHENQKLSAEKEAHENTGSKFDENELYHIGIMSIEYTKGKLIDVSARLNVNLNIYMGLKIRMIWSIYMITM